MRILHTADLHIGKIVNNFSMLEDQKYILAQMIEMVKEQNADVLILAGDVYDRPIPSAEAVEVFHDFIQKLHETGVEIFCISGNHDSPERLSFAQESSLSLSLFLSLWLCHSLGCYLMLAPSDCPQGIQAWSLH